LFIEHATRRVHLAIAIDVDRFRFRFRDNATVFDAAFDENFTTNRLDVIRTPPEAPHANATAERFVRTARTELLDHTPIWNEHQLRKLLVEYLEHYNGHRPHRGINQRSPDSIDRATPDPVPIDEIQRRRVLNRRINEYHAAA
jgi:putative transposase